MRYECGPSGKPVRLTFEDDEPQVVRAAYTERRQFLADNGCLSDFEIEGEDVLRWPEKKTEMVLETDEPLSVVSVLDIYFRRNGPAATDIACQKFDSAEEAKSHILRRLGLGEQAGKLALDISIEIRIADFNMKLDEIGPEIIINGGLPSGGAFD